jgi:hypothetical protein
VSGSFEKSGERNCLVCDASTRESAIRDSGTRLTRDSAEFLTIDLLATHVIHLTSLIPHLIPFHEPNRGQSRGRIVKKDLPTCFAALFLRSVPVVQLHCVNLECLRSTNAN